MHSIRKELLPTIEDYEGAILGIHRLEDTYLLKPKDLALGKISAKHSSRPLTGNIFIKLILSRVTF
jgi:hypothetical protein